MPVLFGNSSGRGQSIAKMPLRQAAEDYFGSINSMARRIHIDMKETQLSYENLWDTLTYEEQQQILNQTIVKPEVSLKYPLRADKDDEQIAQYAVKMIVDDSFTCRDEHSAPFTFRTSSQRDLSITTKRVSPKKKAAKKAVVTPVIPVPKMPVNVVPEVRDLDVMDNDTDEADANSLTHFLPKTGLDLLDNW